MVTYEDSLAREGYGPDILPEVDNKALVECGLTPDDAIRLKCGARDWWNGPEAKHTQQDIFQNWTATEKYPIHFEKCFANGGSVSFFGSGLMKDGRPSKKYSWWYYNTITHAGEQVPVGSVPVLEHFYEDSFGGRFENKEDKMDDEAAGGGFVDSFSTQAARGDGDEAEVKTGPRRGPKTLRKSDDRMRTKIYSEKMRM